MNAAEIVDGAGDDLREGAVPGARRPVEFGVEVAVGVPAGEGDAEAGAADGGDMPVGRDLDVIQFGSGRCDFGGHEAGVRRPEAHVEGAVGVVAGDREQREVGGCHRHTAGDDLAGSGFDRERPDRLSEFGQTRPEEPRRFPRDTAFAEGRVGGPVAAEPCQDPAPAQFFGRFGEDSAADQDPVLGIEDHRIAGLARSGKRGVDAGKATAAERGIRYPPGGQSGCRRGQDRHKDDREDEPLREAEHPAKLAANRGGYHRTGRARATSSGNRPDRIPPLSATRADRRAAPAGRRGRGRAGRGRAPAG